MGASCESIVMEASPHATRSPTAQGCSLRLKKSGLGKSLRASWKAREAISNSSHFPVGLSSPGWNEETVQPSCTYFAFEAKRGAGTQKLAEGEEDQVAVL